jgi:predicted nucleotidyltransferase component of viral defense system
MGSPATLTSSASGASQMEAAHIEIMRAIAEDLIDLPMVLKGGTALLLCYGLDRFSEDLDFDAPKKFNISGRVEKVLSRYAHEFSVKTVKDTETVQRLKVHYRKEAVDRLLKIETSFRQSPSTESVEVRGGIKTYKVSGLIDQKLAALVGRTKARDLYDVAFLARTYRDQFSEAAMKQLADITTDLDALEGRFRLAFEDDSILRVEQLQGLILQLGDLA